MQWRLLCLPSKKLTDLHTGSLLCKNRFASLFASMVSHSREEHKNRRSGTNCCGGSALCPAHSAGRFSVSLRKSSGSLRSSGGSPASKDGRTRPVAGQTSGPLGCREKRRSFRPFLHLPLRQEGGQQLLILISNEILPFEIPCAPRTRGGEMRTHLIKA